jgi:N-acyl-L-homoserine lactone synthetase
MGRRLQGIRTPDDAKGVVAVIRAPSVLTDPPIDQGIRDFSYQVGCVGYTDMAHMDAIRRLRHAYFVEERGWAAPDPTAPGRESDAYDPHCFHLAVFEQEDGAPRIATYLRALPWREGTGFMLQREFSPLLPANHQLVTSNSVELSRLVVAPRIKAQGASATRHVVELLLRLLYRLSIEQGWDAYYVVVEEAWLTAFVRRYRLPFEALGEPFTFPDGTRTVAAVAHRKEMEEAVRRSDPAKFAWYAGGE